MAERIGDGTDVFSEVRALVDTPEYDDPRVRELENTFRECSLGLGLPVPEGWTLASGNLQVNSIDSGIPYLSVSGPEYSYTLSLGEGQVVIYRVPTSGEPTAVTDGWEKIELMAYALGHTNHGNYRLGAVAWSGETEHQYNHFIHALASEEAEIVTHGVNFRDTVCGMKSFRVITANVTDRDGVVRGIVRYEVSPDGQEYRELALSATTPSAEQLFVSTILGGYEIDKSTGMLVIPGTPMHASSRLGFSGQLVGRYYSDVDIKNAENAATKTAFEVKNYSEIGTLISQMCDVDVYAFRQVKNHPAAMRQVLLDNLALHMPKKELVKVDGVHILSVSANEGLVIRMLVQESGLSETYELLVVDGAVQARQVEEKVIPGNWRNPEKKNIIRTGVGESETAILLEAIASGGMNGSVLQNSILSRATLRPSMYRPSSIPEKQFDPRDNDKKNKVPMFIRALRAKGYFDHGAVVHRDKSGREQWYIQRKINTPSIGLFGSRENATLVWFRVEEARDNDPLFDPPVVAVRVEEEVLLTKLNQANTSIMPVDM